MSFRVLLVPPARQMWLIAREVGLVHDNVERWSSVF